MLFSPRSPFNTPSRWLSRAAFPLFDLRDKSDRMRELGRLLKTQYRSPGQHEAYQMQALRALLRDAIETVPYYRERREVFSSAHTLADLPCLPVLTKTEVRAAGDSLITTDAKILATLQSAKTGGSTGVSLSLKFDHTTQQHRNAAALRSDMWAGWRPGHWTGALWGSPEYPASLTAKLRNVLRDRLVFLDTMRLDPRSMTAFLTLMHSRRIDALFGHAHSLFILADFALDRGISVPPLKAIVSTSMMLLAPERERIEQAFCQKVSDRYGCEEVGLIAAECERHTGYHVASEHIIVEVIDEAGRPCAPGEVGRVIVTDLQNRGMPLIRYEVGDLAAWARVPCPCGRGLPTLERIVGRQADCLKRLDGSLLAGVSLVERTLLAIPGLAQLRLEQETQQTLTAFYVEGEGVTSQTAVALKQALVRDLGPGITVKIERVARIPQERNGKYRFAVRRF